ncbi:MAG: hypothetical protein ACTSVE_06465, partial [Candidatus Helarchaeota archaeon]
KALNEEKDEEIKELKKKISELVKKNLLLVKEKSDLEEKIASMDEVVKNFEEMTEKVQKDFDKLENVWKGKVLEGHRKIRALEKLLNEKRKAELDMKSLTLQKYVQSYKDKISKLEEQLEAANKELAKYKEVSKKSS